MHGKMTILNNDVEKSNFSAVEKITIVLMNLLHLPISALFHQDIILHIQAVYQWQVRSMHSLIRVWFLNPFRFPNSQCGAYNQQKYKYQCCFCVDCILQILFSSYRISLSFNQSFVTKIRSISISSPCHFYFVLYCFIDFSCPCICPYQSS